MTLRASVVALGALGLSLAAGALFTLSPQAVFALVLLLVALALLDAPAGAWAVAALIATLCFRALVQLGLLPSIATFADIALSWGALVSALLRVALRRWLLTPDARALLRRLALLALAVLVAWLFHLSEVLRPIVYLALLGQPFALLGALLLDPPQDRLRRSLIRTLAVLIAVQVPIAFAQAMGHLISGRGDPVQGTLYGAGAGTDTMAAIVAVGAFWLLASVGPMRSLWRVGFAAAAFAIPLVADAKQVVLALPAGLVAVRPRRLRSYFLQAVAVAGAIAFLMIFGPSTTDSFLRQSAEGRGGKEAAARFVWSKQRGDPASVVFGLGPAETVSRAAFMTTDLLLSSASPLRALALRPAPVAVEAEQRALAVSGGGTSFNSGVSSTLGVLGDLGVAGLVAYLALPIWIIRRLRRTAAPSSTAAAAGWGMLLVLGLVFDWWEQPPFATVLAVLSGLAIASAGDHRSVRNARGSASA